MNLIYAFAFRFCKDVTHLVFWNGSQDLLDKAYEKGFSSLIVAPHWVNKLVDIGSVLHGPISL